MRKSSPSKPFLIFFSLSALLTFSLFYRFSNAVIAPNLIQDLGLNAETLGMLGGAYFYSFALLQLPLGPMLDRIGPRLVVTFSAFTGALGAFLFAFAESFFVAFLGRVLIGLGMASILMGSFKVFIIRYPPEKFTTLSGMIISIGTLGSILAASPLAYLTSTIGWRMTFILAGGITAILACLVFWVLGGTEGKSQSLIFPPQSKPEIGVLQSIRLIFGSFAFWQLGTMAFFGSGTFYCLQGLWLGPYLMEIKGFSPVETGNALILLAIGIIVGSPMIGWLSDRTLHSKKVVALWGSSLYTLSLFPLLGIVKIQSPFWYGFIFFFMSFFRASIMVLYSYAKELFPITISGTTITLVNFFAFAGGAVFMPFLGKIIGAFPRVNHGYPAEAYHLAFLICFLGMAASVIFYAFSKKERRGDRET